MMDIENSIFGKTLYNSARKESRQKENSIQEKERERESEGIEERYYDLIKNSTILAGTICASTIALSNGGNNNFIFIVGELFLLISTSIGAIYLLSILKGKETIHFLFTKYHLQNDLIVNKDIIDEFELKQKQELIDTYQKLYDKKDLLYYFLKIIKIDWLKGILFTTLICGLFLIWLSLFFPSEKNTNVNIPANISIQVR